MIHKEHKEFYKVDLDAGWEVPPGYPAGIEQQILSGSLNEGRPAFAPATSFQAGRVQRPRSSTRTGRRSTSSRAISSSETTLTETVGRNSVRTRTPAGRRAHFTARSSRKPAACSSSCTTTTKSDRNGGGPASNGAVHVPRTGVPA